MLHTLPTNQPVTKVKSNPQSILLRPAPMQNQHFDLLNEEEDEDDFLAASLEEVNFDELTIDDADEFSYDDDIEEDMEIDEED